MASKPSRPLLRCAVTGVTASQQRFHRRSSGGEGCSVLNFQARLLFLLRQHCGSYYSAILRRAMEFLARKNVVCWGGGIALAKVSKKRNLCFQSGAWFSFNRYLRTIISSTYYHCITQGFFNKTWYVKRRSSRFLSFKFLVEVTYKNLFAEK